MNLPAPHTTMRESAGAYLLSLDPELYPDLECIRQAIVIQSLFVKRICLTDAHLFASASFQDFLKNQFVQLSLEDPDKIPENGYPLFGSCGRSGINIDEGLQRMLNQYIGDPTYLSSVSPNGNASLREKCQKGLPTQVRNETLFDIDNCYARHICRLKQYFSKCGQRAAVDPPVPALQGPQDTLFEIVTNFMEQMDSHEYSTLFRYVLDTQIMKRLRHIIENPTQPSQTREALHNEIYENRLPRFYRGKWYFENQQISAWDKRHEWRQLINIIYNMNLSQQLVLQPVRNSNWFNVNVDIQSYLKELFDQSKEQVINIPLRSCLYPHELRLKHVIQIREKAYFWESLDSVYSATTKEFPDAFAKHLSYLTNEIADAISDGHGPRLIYEERSQLITNRSIEFLGVGFSILPTIICYLCNLRPDQIMLAPLPGLIVTSIGAIKSMNKPNFASFMGELKQVGKTIVE